jgi:hypothetical protein
MKFDILSMRYDGIHFRNILRMFVISFFLLSPIFVQVAAFVIERHQIIQFRSSSLSSITDGTLDENENNSYNANIQLTEDPTSKMFLDWMFHQRRCQGEEDAVKILVNEQTGHRGLYVIKDVAEGDCIFAIPFQSAWIVEKEEEDGKDKKTAKELSDAERGFRFLMWQRRLRDTESQDDDDNNWKPYLEILPTYDIGTNDIASWTTEQIASLELPPIIQRALSKKQTVEELASQNEKTVHLNELRFATWLVNSRAITVIVDDNDDDDDDGIENDNEGDEEEEENDDRNDDENKNISTNCVLVPLLDMINHSSEKPNAYYSVLGDDGHDDDDDDDDEDSQLYYAIVADRDIQKNEELLTSYGSEEDSSLDLLMQYGFVPDYNPFDVNFWEFYSQTQTITMTNVIDSFWSTTLEQDEDRLSELILSIIPELKENKYLTKEDEEEKIKQNDNDNDRITISSSLPSLSSSPIIERSILEFRIRMKRSFIEWKQSIRRE